MWRLRAGIGLFGFALLVGCGSQSTLATVRTSGASTSSLSAVGGVHFINATLVWDSGAPINPGGPNMRVSGEVVSGSGAAVHGGVIKAYVLDGPPGRASDAVATIDVGDGTFAQTFGVVGPGGNKIRLDYVQDGKVLASTVLKD